MIRLIAAIDRSRGIAKNGFQPWLVPRDEQYFSEKTKSLGGKVLVGGITYRTLKGPLPDRTTYVLTRDKTPIEGVELVHDLEKFLKEIEQNDLWVIGGANVYSQVMELGLADELYLTHVQAEFGCTQFFPKYETDYKLTGQSDLQEQNGFIYSFATYARNPVG